MGEKKTVPSMILPLLLFSNFLKSFGTRENSAAEQQGLVFKVPKGEKLWECFFFSFFVVAVSSADCRCCEDSFKRRETNSDGRGRAIRQLEATMILSNSSRGKTDSES